MGSKTGLGVYLKRVGTSVVLDVECVHGEVRHVCVCLRKNECAFGAVSSSYMMHQSRDICSSMTKVRD